MGLFCLVGAAACFIQLHKHSNDVLELLVKQLNNVHPQMEAALLNYVDYMEGMVESLGYEIVVGSWALFNIKGSEPNREEYNMAPALGKLLFKIAETSYTTIQSPSEKE